MQLRGALIDAGRFEDVHYEDADTASLSFELLINGCSVKVIATSSDTSSDVLDTEVQEGGATQIEGLFKGFQYIQSDRLVPANQYLQADTRTKESGWLGCKGEYTVDFLHRSADQKVAKRRCCPREFLGSKLMLLDQVAPTDSLLDQVSGWLQFLSPGVKPQAKPVDLADAASLRFEYTGAGITSASKPRRPINVGFGLTYALPVIVACLSAPEGGFLMLENPEAHLHPRGQSALGLLLAICAADGVQVVVETHSDHLLNGIRIAVKRGLISPSDTVFHYFERDVETGCCKKFSPSISANGRFNDWPEGFFDEWSNALDELVGT